MSERDERKRDEDVVELNAQNAQPPPSIHPEPESSSHLIPSGEDLPVCFTRGVES